MMISSIDLSKPYKFGVIYQGSKTKINYDLFKMMRKNSPDKANHFIDLFGGGGGMSFNALAYGYKVHYNELYKPTFEMMKYLLSCIGRKNEFGMLDDSCYEWISREEFNRLKSKPDKTGRDFLMLNIYSFGNDGKNYFCNNPKEKIKKSLHHAIVYDDYSLVREWYGKDFPILSGDLHQKRMGIQFLKHNRGATERFVKFCITKILNLTMHEASLVLSKSAKREEELREYLREALKKSGLTQKEINDRLGTQMSTHYFSKSQWSFPTFEAYTKLQQWLDLPLNYFECVNPYLEQLQQLQQLEQLEQLQQLQQLQQLEQLERLQQLERLERLQQLERLERLERLTITNLDYRDVIIETLPSETIVYADPPYKNTDASGYGENYSFDYGEFYDFLSYLAKRGFSTFCSEYNIDDERFECIWAREVRNNKVNGAPKRIEKLYKVLG